MKNEIKLFVYSALVLVSFFAAFIFFMNDKMNYALLCISFTVVCVIGLVIHIFTKSTLISALF